MSRCPFFPPTPSLPLGHILTVPYDKVNSHIKADRGHRHTTCASLSPLADHLFVYLYVCIFQHDRYIYVCVLACLYIDVSPAWSPLILFPMSLPFFPFPSLLQLAAKVKRVRASAKETIDGMDCTPSLSHSFCQHTFTFEHFFLALLDHAWPGLDKQLLHECIRRTHTDPNALASFFTLTILPPLFFLLSSSCSSSSSFVRVYMSNAFLCH